MAQFELRDEHIPEDLYWLYELVGMERFLKIIDTAGGEFLYFPKRSTLERTLRRQAIVKEYDGTNLRQLSRKYGLTDRHIRTILQEEGLRKTS
ncbi:MAG: hypothetical protein IJN18_04280 [Clostridia bacterium]|nr:hypothetical protein [Clostridia bacterium]MBQ6711523.1 hypothetical protein [Clostridia bacterium]